MNTSIDIAIPCNKWQQPTWWQALLAESLRCQRNGLSVNNIIAVTGALTDTARNRAVDDFLAGQSEWLFFNDDDTVIPLGTISHLLAKHKPFVSGLYYGRVKIKDGETPLPLAYTRAENGEYTALEHFPRGAIIPVDGIGLGCALIHRGVFSKIRAAHVLCRKPTGPYVPVWPDDLEKYQALGWSVVETLPDGKPYPYFVFDNGRTEDFFFCELAARVGVRPIVDTDIECGHIGEYTIDGEDFRDALRALRRYQA